jgi:large subunit ribosomal protein L46
MRETAERALNQHCGSSLTFSVLGNAPLSFYKYKYPRSYREANQRLGAKVFLFKAYLTSAFGDAVNVEMGEGVLDYTWATLQERADLFLKKKKFFLLIFNILWWASENKFLNKVNF